MLLWSSSCTLCLEGSVPQPRCTNAAVQTATDRVTPLNDAACRPTCSRRRAPAVALTSCLTSLCTDMCVPLKQHLPSP